MNRRALIPALAAALLATTAAGCASSHGGRASAPPATAGTPYDPIAACARKLDYWVTTDFLQGKPDLGDYQEMGLSGAEGLALRHLEEELAAAIKAFPAPAPPDLKQHETLDCTKAGAATPNAANWP